MLQQTQVTTVWPYYRKWMQSYPDVKGLAAANEDQILKHWEGLGYYSRARNLHRGARYVLETHSGKLPVALEELLKIPGVGPYTAAAISSLAFGRPVPLVDGNVLRVFTRLTRNGSDITLSRTKKEIESSLADLIPHDEPEAFNQGLMDLGRVICMPRNPLCGECPLNQSCEAFKAGDVADFPNKPTRKKTPHYEIAIGLIRKEGKLLIQKRPSEGLLGGLWEFPGGKIEAGESGETALLREIQEETGLKVALGTRIGTIQHAYTHFRITLTAWYCDWQGGKPKTLAATENRWVSRADLGKYAFPKANLKILDLIA